MTKKILALLGAALFAFAIAGCNKTEEGAEKSMDAMEKPAEAPAAEPAMAAPAEAAPAEAAPAEAAPAAPVEGAAP